MTDTPDRINWRNLPPVAKPFVPPPNWIPSQTMLRAHDNCDRDAYLYLMQRGGGSSHPLNRGGIFHDVIERLLRMMAEREEPEIAPEIGREVLYEVMREQPESQVPANERDALRYMVDHWCRGVYISTPIIGIETTFTLVFDIPGYGQVTVLARADLVTSPGSSVCEITDWKTAFPPSAEDFTAQAYDDKGRPRWAGNYQLNMLAVLARFGMASDGLPLGDFDRYRLTVAYPREIRAEGIVRREVEVEALQLQAFKDDLQLQLERLVQVNLGEQKWQPTPGSHCAICTASRLCPLPAYLRPDSQMAEAEEAADLEQMLVNAEFMSSRAAAIRRRVKKAAEKIEEANPGALKLPSGDIGIKAGADIAYIFVPYEKEEIRDKAAYEAAWEDVARGGPLPDPKIHKRIKSGTEFAKRKVGKS